MIIVSRSFCLQGLRMRVSKLGLQLVAGLRLSFVRVSWPIKHDIAKKINTTW